METLSSADIPLSPDQISIKRAGFYGLSFPIVIFVLIILFYLLTGVFNISIDTSDLTVKIIGLVIFSVAFISLGSYLGYAWCKNFYFKCDDEKVEVSSGFLNLSSYVVPYNIITGVSISTETWGGGGKAGNTSGGISTGVYGVSVMTNRSKFPYIFGGFTQENAQKIVDFISARIKK